MSQFLQKLSPMYPSPLIGFTVYIIIILALITLMMQGKKGNLTITIFIAIVVVSGLLDKLVIVTPGSFASFMIRVVMFTFPLVTAGMTKAPKSRAPAVLAGVIAVVYLFARWFFEQKPA